MSAHDYIAIFVRCSLPDKSQPLTAFIGGTQLEGCGKTVLSAIEDLLTDGQAAQVCRQLEESVKEKAL